MSYSVSNNNIILTRGDTAKIQVTIKTSTGEDYIPAAGDVVRFTMKRFISDKSPVLVKDIPTDSLLPWLAQQFQGFIAFPKAPDISPYQYYMIP